MMTRIELREMKSVKRRAVVYNLDVSDEADVLDDVPDTLSQPSGAGGEDNYTRSPHISCRLRG